MVFRRKQFRLTRQRMRVRLPVRVRPPCPDLGARAVVGSLNNLALEHESGSVGISL